MKFKRSVPAEIRQILENNEILKKEAQKFDFTFNIKKSNFDGFPYGYKLFYKVKEIGANANKKGALVINTVFGDAGKVDGFNKKQAIPKITKDVKEQLNLMKENEYTNYFKWYYDTSKKYEEQVRKIFGS